jgi:hypothetical protein
MKYYVFVTYIFYRVAMERAAILDYKHLFPTSILFKLRKIISFLHLQWLNSSLI